MGEQYRFADCAGEEPEEVNHFDMKPIDIVIILLIADILLNINTHFKIKQIMATDEQFRQALTRIETATTNAGTAITAVGARITSLEETIKNMGLTTAQEDELLAKTEGLGTNLETLATALTEMGKTPETPVPVPVPDPIPPVEG